jgi:hypothetical protein
MMQLTKKQRLDSLVGRRYLDVRLTLVMKPLAGIVHVVQWGPNAHFGDELTQG